MTGKTFSPCQPWMRWCDYGGPCCLNPVLPEETENWQRLSDAFIWRAQEVTSTTDKQTKAKL